MQCYDGRNILVSYAYKQRWLPMLFCIRLKLKSTLANSTCLADSGYIVILALINYALILFSFIVDVLSEN